MPLTFSFSLGSVTESECHHQNVQRLDGMIPGRSNQTVMYFLCVDFEYVRNGANSTECFANSEASICFPLLVLR